MNCGLVKVLLFLVLSLAAQESIAETISLRSDPEIADKDFTIEARLTPISQGKLKGEDQTADIPAAVLAGKSKISATFTVENLENDVGLSINLFSCRKDCNWIISIPKIENTDSENVNRLCVTGKRTINGLFERYFFCRKAFRGHFSAQGACWPEAVQALRGWFDAAYILHTQTLSEGTAFVARDREVEAMIRDSALACKDERGASAAAGYYAGMQTDLDKTMLQATQKVERLLKAGDKVAARRWAETLVQEIHASPSIRNSISRADINYVEAILNRALRDQPPFVLP